MKPAVYFLLIIALFAACRKEISHKPVRPEHYNGYNFNEIFEAFWNGMNVNYCFWDIDSTNWDEVYKKYKPLFAALDYNDYRHQVKAGEYFREMMQHMQDGHLWMTRNYWNGFNDTTFFYQPVAERQMARGDYHDSIPASHFDEVLPERYLKPGYRKGLVPADPNDPNSFGDVSVVFGELKTSPVLYLHISSFQLRELYERPDNNSVQLVLKHYIDVMKNVPAHIKGLVIDVRSNGGGSTADLDFIVGRLVDRKYVYGYNRYKNGNGRLDFGPWVPAYVNPPAGSRAFTRPVIVLADINTGSMAEATTMAVKAMPNGTVVGERTFGRLAAIGDNLETNAGKFSFENNKSSMSLSSSAFKFKDGNIYEGIGVPPDVEAKYDAASLQAGRDTQLEKAVSLIP